MIAFDRGLTAYTDRYLMGRDCAPDYANTLRARVGKFCAWCGSDIPIDALTCELLNEWLAELSEGGMNAWTLDGYRRNVMAVWKFAYEIGDNDNPPLRVRRIKKPRLIIEAYTHTEIHALLKQAAKLKGLHVDDNKASDFWQAAIHVAYSCGPRRGDLLRLEWRHVAPDGRITFLQNKTGYTNTVRLSAQAVMFAALLHTTSLVLPWPYQRNWFGVTFKRLRLAAGVTRGSFKWIRRSAGSYAESVQPGAGARLLGHRDGRMFKRFYEDETISGTAAPQPPPL